MTGNLHIVHVTESVRGGTSTYVAQLVADNLKRGYQVSIIADERMLTSELKRLSVPRYHYDSTRRPLRIFKAVLGVKKLLSEIAPDIAHLHGSFPGLYARAIKSPFYKVVYCAHGWPFCQDIPWIEKHAYAYVERWLNRKTNATINISHSERSAAMRWGLTGTQVVIRNGVGPSRATGAHVIEPKADRVNLGFIGRFDRQKGLEILLDAMSKCRNPAVHLWVAGAHDRDRRARQETGSNVTFIGWLDADRVDDFISDLDAVVMPSRWEGFGLVGIEAMRNGKALIASDRGALPEMLIHGFNGLLFSLDEPLGLARTLETCDRERLRKMGENALAVYRETFGMGSMLEQINSLYQTLAFGQEAQSNCERGAFEHAV